MQSEEIGNSIVLKLQKIHPELDFSQCNPLRTSEYINVICPVHGKFRKRVLKMLYKPFQGCPSCGSERRNKDRVISRDLWVEGVKAHWGDSIDTTESIFSGVCGERTLVKCKIHGEVNVNAGDLYRGTRSCPLCGIEKRTKKLTGSLESFLVKVKSIYGEKYDYSNIQYEKGHKNIRVICKEHGEFISTPSRLLQGHGCSTCGIEKQKKTVQEKKHREYVEKLKKKFGDKFDFTLVNYINRTTPIIIVCKEHGPFEATPWNFLNEKHGCPHCSGKYLCNDEFKAKAEKIHGVGRYTYDLVQTTKHKFGVTCNICGLYWDARPNSILNGSGCPNCAKSGFHPQAPAVLYNIEFTLPTGVKLYKVGITNNTTTERIMNMKIKSGISYKILDEIHYAIGRDANDQEQELKRDYAEYQYTGKKFMKNGYTEIFTVNPFTYAL